MTTSLVANSARKFFVNTVALATLVAGTLLVAPTADARRISCLAKYQGCQNRCLSSGGLASTGWYACVNRTCNPQYDYCARYN
jgi:hypothetical protein